MLATLHNVHFYLNLMEQIRAALAEGRFGAFKRQFLADYLREEKKTRHVR
jgi:queuine tRNA-ribosyltransferase